MKAFITGIGGFIGSQIAGALVSQGWEVAGIDSHLGRRAPHGSVQSHPGDVRHPRTWQHLLDGADVAYHAAAIHHVESVTAHPERSIAVNVKGTLRALEATVAAGIQQFILLSSAKVYGEAERLPSTESDLPAPIEWYGLAKVVCEHYLDLFAQHYGLRTTAVRPFSVYGPGQDLNTGYLGALLSSMVRGHHAVLLGAPDYQRDFVHIDDVARTCVALAGMDNPPRILNATSGRAVCLQDASTMPSVAYEPARPGTIRRTHGDASILQRLLGTEPIQLEDGLASTVQWFEEHRSGQP